MYCMLTESFENIICRICHTIAEEEAIKPCKCDRPIHNICLVNFIKYKKELGSEAKCSVCSESFDYRNKQSCTRCCSRMCSDIVNVVLRVKHLG